MATEGDGAGTGKFDGVGRDRAGGRRAAVEQVIGGRRAAGRNKAGVRCRSDGATRKRAREVHAVERRPTAQNAVHGRDAREPDAPRAGLEVDRGTARTRPEARKNERPAVGQRDRSGTCGGS